MNISEFIRKHVDAVVEEWVEFARDHVPPTHGFTHEELADHAKELLLALAVDIGDTQGAQAKYAKSRGDRPDNAPDITSIARDHAVQRFDQGFSLVHLISEFRALRASVIRRWTEQLGQPRPEDLKDLTRFGESMDQALTESACLYTKKVDDSRNLLLGVLGHDLRTPLGVVHMSAHYLLRADTLTGGQTKAAARILTAAERMGGMVKDILDFTQTAFGVALPISPAAADFGEITRSIVSEITILHPDSRLELTCQGNLAGRWDGARIAQMLANLTANAVQHGAAGKPITIVVAGEVDAVSVRISNAGTPIPAEAHENLFLPMRQTPTLEHERRAGSSGMGLGLYITKAIATAHGGTVELASDEEQTTFSVRIPRTPPAANNRRAADLPSKESAP